MSSKAAVAGGDARATRWAGQHQRRRAEFVDAALTAIAEHGPEVATEQIAAQAGVARTRLYKHFAGADDLRREITRRVLRMLDEQLEPVWNPHGSPLQMITVAVETYVRWVSQHPNLYRYLLRSAPRSGWGEVDTAIGEHLNGLFGGYLGMFGLDPAPAQTAAFGLVGFAGSAVSRWLEHPGGISPEQLAAQISRAAWAVCDATLRAGGVELDPDQPLPAPEECPPNP